MNFIQFATYFYLSCEIAWYDILAIRNRTCECNLSYAFLRAMQQEVHPMESTAQASAVNRSLISTFYLVGKSLYEKYGPISTSFKFIFVAFSFQSQFQQYELEKL